MGGGWLLPKPLPPQWTPTLIMITNLCDEQPLHVLPVLTGSCGSS